MLTMRLVAVLAVGLPTCAGLAMRPVAHLTVRAPSVAPPLARAAGSSTAPSRRVPLAGHAIAAAAAARHPNVVATATPMDRFRAFSNTFSNLFPVWTLLVAVLGLVTPGVFLGISTNYFTLLLGLLMLSMGITLTLDDFKRVLARPAIMGLGFLGCYGLMPALAIALGKLMRLPSSLIAGMVLVGSINGGQASNLCTYIAKGDVALSVLMTTCTTIGAIVMTPLLCKVLLGAIVPVDAVGVAISTIQVVLVPIVLGMGINANFPKAVKNIEPFSPIVGVLSTCVLVGSAVAQCAAPILAAGASLQLAAALLHILGGLAAYFSLKPLGYGETTCRTFAIETSMKSSAFGFLLAKLHFADPLVRVTPAVSVVWMALVGSSLAVLFRALPAPADE